MNPILIIILTVLSLPLSYFLYYILTIKKKKIIIKKKYIMEISDEQYYIIQDKNNDIYKIDLCIWNAYAPHIS